MLALLAALSACRPGAPPRDLPDAAGVFTGRLERGQIQEVVNRHLDEVMGCVEREMLRDPGACPGKIQVEWVITSSGAVRDVRLVALVAPSRQGAAKAADCTMDRIRAWRFPPPTGGEVQVSYPFMPHCIGF